jgi:two-component system, OmpR family, phosphate regulon sensor histidine kinase PhoR
MTRTIRWRLAIPYALLVILTMVGLSVYLVSYVRTTYQANLEQSLTSEAHLVADSLASDLSPLANQVQLQTRVQQYATRLGVRITVIDPDGKVLAESEADPALLDNHLTRPEVQGALKGLESNAIRHSDTLHIDMLYVAVPIESGGRVIGAARLAVTLQLVEASLAQIRQTATLATLIAILLAVLLSTLLSGYTIRPLKQLTEITRKMTLGDFESTPLPATHDEVGELNKAFNQMAVQLRDQIRALKTEQGKLEAVLAHMTDGVLIVDEENRVKLINPAAQRMFDVTERTAIGRSVVEVIRNHQLVELLRKCQATGEQQTTTLELSAERLFLQAIATSLKQAIPGSTLLLVQDLTRLRRLETVRQDFISNVSHELRTPLASLKALAETLQEGALEDPPAAHRFLGRMETEIDTLTQMVQELLELARIESGRVPLRRQAILPKALVSHAVERMSMQAERAGLRLCLECPEDLPPVSADPDRMEQVLVNLLHNAVKFTPPGGEIVVSAAPEEGRVIFSVRDTGVGIPAKDLPRIFERFYKADRARSGGGTGLGLSISRHIVETHGGKIWADSIQGKGSTFYFSLPVQSH